MTTRRHSVVRSTIGRCIVSLSMLLTLAVPQVSCSYLFVRQAPENHQQLEKVNCTSSRGWPITDTVFGGIFLVGAVTTAAQGERRNADGEREQISVGARVASTATLAALSALFSSSAYFGFRWAGQCRQFKQERVARPPDEAFEGGVRIEGSITADHSKEKTQIFLRTGEVLQGEVLGTVVVVTERVDADARSVAVYLVEAADIEGIHSGGIELRPGAPEQRAVIAADETRMPAVGEALAFLARYPRDVLMSNPSGTVLATGYSRLRAMSGKVAGELQDATTGTISGAIRIKTSSGESSVAVAELGEVTPSGGAPATRVEASGTPSVEDWTTEYQGRGNLTVRVVNGSSVGVFVKIKDSHSRLTAAQVHVAGADSRVVYLNGGSFQVLMRSSIHGKFRYFKGQPLSIPKGMRGEATLSVGVPGPGQALEEIDAAEFNR